MTSTSLLGLIGNTPLIELTRLSPNPRVRIFAKLEGQNPGGSIKDRIVQAIVESAERRGVLKPGDTIVEASSGNTAIALAMVAKRKGYKVRVVMPRNVAPSVADILQIYGAEIAWSSLEGGMIDAIGLARRIAEQEGLYPLGQFTDQLNPEVHYQTTGAEIAAALPKVDVFVAGIGTGGTLIGVGRRLREMSPHVRIVGVEPKPGERVLGLRSLEEGFIPPLLDLSKLDGRFLVDSATAIQAARLLIESEGIMAGISSGATLHAALRVARDIDQGNVVVMFADGAWKYLPARPWDAAQEGSPALDEVHWW